MSSQDSVLTNELLPCPFCGGAVRWCVHESHGGCHFILCDGCKSEMNYWGPDTDEASLEEARRVAAMKWNRRLYV